MVSFNRHGVVFISFVERSTFMRSSTHSPRPSPPITQSAHCAGAGSARLPRRKPARRYAAAACPNRPQTTNPGARAWERCTILRPIAERLLGAAADDIGSFDDLVADDQQPRKLASDGHRSNFLLSSPEQRRMSERLPRFVLPMIRLQWRFIFSRNDVLHPG